MKLVTRPLRDVEVLAELEWLAEFLYKGGVGGLLIEYGWGCRLPTDKLWKDLDVTSSALVAFVTKSVAGGIYVPGDSDLIIRDHARTFEYMPCHESHIHFAATDERLCQAIAKRWKEGGLDGWHVNDDNATTPLES